MRGVVLALLAVFCLSIFPPLWSVQAQASAAATLAADIDEFFSRGAKGFLVWQYGGDYSGRQIAVDQYSFYRDRDPDICRVMQEKASANPDKFIGVNINNIGAIEFNQPDNDGNTFAAQHMAWLKANCGVTVIRVFAKIEGAAGVQNALTAAQQAGIQLIVAIGDYSNGGGGMPQGAGIDWYQSGFRGEYMDLVNQLVPLVSHPALYGFELANEPHCGGNAAAIDAYKNWGIEVGSKLSGTNVGFGQMASQNTTRCDSPGPGDFLATNAIATITMTSAHYYNDQEKANALLALSQSKQIGRPFYIGEAPPGDIGAEGQSFEADDAWYYLHPIRGVSPGGIVAERSVDIIRDDLANQGYQAYCAANPAVVKLEITTTDTLNRFIELTGGMVAHTTSTYEQDTQQTRTGIYRDIGGKRFFNSSLEEYFGYIDSVNKTPSRAEIQTAPVNSLLSAEQRCIQSVRALRAAELMCERLTQWDKCALFSRPVPGTNWNVKDLLEKINGVMDYRAGKIEEGCRQLFANAENTSSHNELQRAILNTPYYIDRSYRLAFMVTSLEYKREAGSELFNFFSPKHIDDPRHEVLITTFKIPDILTNKGGGETSGHTYWDDPAIITRNVLVPQTKNDEYKLGAENLRRETQAAAKAASIQTTDSTIYCTNGTASSPACQDELGKAVVDIINGKSPSCDTNRDEAVTEILDSAQVPRDILRLNQTGLIFDPGYGFGELTLLELLKNYTDSSNSQLAKTQPVASLFKLLGGWTNNETAEVSFYLVYPSGYELQEVTNVFQSTFFTNEQARNLVKQEQPADRFELKDANRGINGGSFYREFEDTADTTNCKPAVNPITGEQLYVTDPNGVIILDGDGQRIPRMTCPKKELSLDIIQSGAGAPGLIGARLGYWLRKTQLALTPVFTKSYAYLESCRTTEQFLLGQCQGGPVKVPTYGGGPKSGAGDACEGVDLSTYPDGDDLVPPYESQTPLIAGTTQTPATPYLGRAMYYADGVMNDVLENRRGQFPESMVKDCEDGTDPKYKGCVALLRSGDMGREIWMKRPGQRPEGPFLVIDVASKRDVSCLLYRSWVVDIDFGTAERWGMVGVGPLDGVQLCTNEQCI